jgi:hypothetical protein
MMEELVVVVLVMVREMVIYYVAVLFYAVGW